MTKTYRVYCLWSVGFERNASLQPIWGRKWDDLIDGNSSPWGFPGGSDGQESVCNAGDSGLILGGFVKMPWRRKWQPTLVFLPGESHGQRGLAGYSPWGRKESDSTEQLMLLLFLKEFLAEVDWLISLVKYSILKYKDFISTDTNIY